MSKTFNCPSCSAPMNFEGGESLFQTCKSCNAPIVVPSDILYGSNQKIVSENFASLVNDKPVNIEQVTNELTPSENLPKDDEVIDADARIEKFEVYQEKIGTSSAENKQEFEDILTSDEGFQTEDVYQIEQKFDVVSPEPILDKVNDLLRVGRKIEAIKIFREVFNTGLKEAKDAVEAIERGEDIDISQFLK